MDEIVRYLDMPLVFRAFTILDEDGVYNIYLNSRMPFDQIRKSYAHELSHIKNGDFYRCLTATEIEALAQGRV